MSRIFYGGKYYDYPIKLGNALSNLGVVEAVRCGLSFLWVRIHPPKDQTTLEGYSSPTTAGASTATSSRPTTRRSGACRRRSCPADWGGPADQGDVPVERGVGADPVVVRTPAGPVQAGHQPHRGVPVPEVRTRDDVGAVRRAGRGARRRGPDGARPATAVHVEDGRAVAVTVDHGRRDRAGARPPRDLVHALHRPGPAWSTRRCPPRSVAAADDLHYRDFLTVALVVRRGRGFPDNWIYIHSPDVEGRPHPELRLVVALPGEGRARPAWDGVLRLRGRRPVDHGRRRPGGPGHQGAGRHRAGGARPTSRPATWCGCPRPTRSTTTPTATTSR